MSRLETLEALLVETTEPRARIAALNQLSAHVVRLNLPRALELAETACREAARENDTAGEASALRNRAVCHLIQADLVRARCDYEQALAKSRQCLARDTEAAVLLGLSTLSRKATDYSQAMRLLLEAWRLRQELGDVRGELAPLNNLGALCIELGNYEEAMYFLTIGLQLAREHHDTEHELFCLSNIARIKQDSGDYSDALTDYRLTLELAERVDNRYVRPHILAAMCEAHLKQGQVEAALRVNEEALLLASAGEDHQIELTLLMHLGNICDELGMPEAAEAAFVRALERTQRLGDQERRLEALCQAGEFYLRQERRSEAYDAFLQVYRQAQIVGARRHLARACRALALLEVEPVARERLQEQTEQIEGELKKQVQESRAQMAFISVVL